MKLKLNYTYQNTEFCNSTCTSTRRAIHVHCCTLKQALARNSDLSQQLTINSSTESKSKGGLKIEISK